MYDACSGVSAPVVGTTSLQNLKDILGEFSAKVFVSCLHLIDAIHIELTVEEIKYLEEAYAPMAVLGHL